MNVVSVQAKDLSIVHYPDPRLRDTCAPVTGFGDELRAVADRMLDIMHELNGVGLAAPQVGLNYRLFTMNLTGRPEDDLVFVNPEIHDCEGSAEEEEGCLSLPGINVRVRRAMRCRLTAQDLDGNPIEVIAKDLPARCWQHETDHLNGVLIIDRMGPADRIATKKALKSLEETYKAKVR